MNSNNFIRVQVRVRVQKNCFFEFKFEFGKITDFFRVQVQVRSPAKNPLILQRRHFFWSSPLFGTKKGATQCHHEIGLPPPGATIFSNASAYTRDGADNKNCIRMLRCIRKPCPHAAPHRIQTQLSSRCTAPHHKLYIL